MLAESSRRRKQPNSSMCFPSRSFVGCGSGAVNGVGCLRCILAFWALSCTLCCLHQPRVLTRFPRRYPHVATEVLCSEIWSIAETCLHQSDQLLVPFWDNVLSMSNSELNAKPLIGPNFTRIATVFMAKRPEEVRLSSFAHASCHSFCVFVHRCLPSFELSQTFWIEC